MRTVLVANRKGGVGKTLIAVTLASAMAARGARVGLADADRQGSSLGWLARRLAYAPRIRPLDWSSRGEIGAYPKKLDWLIIDAPGALKGSKAESLIATARAVLTPVQPGVFDAQSTRAFLDEIEDIKRVRKGKVAVHLIANRVRANSRAARELEAMCVELGRPPLAQLTERAIYGELARDGLGLFDRETRALAPVRAQWEPLLEALAD